MKITVLNGPNLNLLGVREPAIYGATTLPEVEAQLTDLARALGVELEFAQENSEGALVGIVHSLRGRVHGAIINAGAYSHSSIAIRDALVGCEIPFVEVHVTNVYAREPERRHSMLAQAAVGVVVGLGTQGYGLALRGLVTALTARGTGA